MVKKELGKICAVRLGDGGYQDAAFGVSFDLGGYGDFWGFWRGEPRPGSEWDAATQAQRYGEAMQRLSNLMKDAKVTDMNKLVGKPIEVTSDSMVLQSWRILTEVL
jgi:hypothetical protein